MKLCIIVPHFNFTDSDSLRWRLSVCRKKLAATGVQHVVAELHRTGVKPDTDTPYCYEATSLLWSKEALFNHVYRQLPPEYDVVGWLDNDVFITGNWVEQSLEAMKDAESVQPFSVSHYLLDGCMDPAQVVEVTRIGCAFFYRHQHEHPGEEAASQTGFSWLYRREVLDAIGGLYPYCFSGVGDYYIGRLLCEPKKGIWLPCHLRQYQSKIEQVVTRPVGFAHGYACHLWHGSYFSRKYDERFSILNTAKPEIDFLLDGPQLVAADTDAGRAIEQYMAGYFRAADTPSRKNHIYKL